jgi:Tol biopolymer transport system component
VAVLAALGLGPLGAGAAAGLTERVSIGANGAQAYLARAQAYLGSGRPDMSADGRLVAFSGYASNLVADDTNRASDVFVHDRKTGSTERVSVGIGGAQADANSFKAALSADGRFVAFASDASNLVAGDTNGARDVFVRDRQNGTTERVSISADGAQANELSGGAAVSADGRFVAF